jgi:hypothetical protein
VGVRVVTGPAQPVRSGRTRQVPDRTGGIGWTDRFLPVFAGLKKLLNSPVVPLRVKSKMNFIIFEIYNFSIIKSAEKQFEFFYPNNLIVSKAISYIFSNFSKIFNLFNRSLFQFLENTIKTVLLEIKLSTYRIDILL